MFQDDFPEDKDNAFLKPPRIAPKTFRLLRVTPHSLKLVQEVIDTSADFDRALKEGCENALETYGELVKARGKLVKYMARLMDMANDNSLNQQRTSQVRFE